jgi:RNA ligase (TIGR02306 family)
MEINRKLASIRKISNISPIEGADKIVVATVGGWKVVTGVNEFKVGDLAIYFEIDSFIPDTIAPFLTRSGHNPKMYNGVAGQVLKTAKLRGQISQGLLMHTDIIQEESLLEEGYDCTTILGIQKWEPEIPACISGLAKGNFPSWGSKTDQERCENLVAEIEKMYHDDIGFEITIKLDGSSCSIGTSPDGEYTVCSRNLSLKTDQDGNAMVNIGRKYNMEEKTKAYPGLLFSGELIGPGIQKNPEKLKEADWYIFDIWDSKEGKYLDSDSRHHIIAELGLKHVPVLEYNISLADLGLKTIQDIKTFAIGKSMYGDNREGIVFKSMDGKFNFKAISTKYLLGK